MIKSRLEYKRELAKTPKYRKTRREYMRLWREKNREKHNEQARKSYAKHRDKRLITQRNAHQKRTYGISLAEKQLLIDKQQSKCAICHKTINLKSHTDHNHKTKEVRGVLCMTCNTHLGWYEVNRCGIEKYLS